MVEEIISQQFRLKNIEEMKIIILLKKYTKMNWCLKSTK